MFLQSYMYQAAAVFAAYHTDPSKLHTPEDKSRAVNRAAIRYGQLEFRAMARRYLHFALPCMPSDIWAHGLKKDCPSYSQIQKKTHEAALRLNKLCYRNRDIVKGEGLPEDIISSNYLETDLSKEDSSWLKTALWHVSVGAPLVRDIPFYDDGHGYNFFYDNTPLDAGRNLLLSQVLEQAKSDPSRAVALPVVDELFGHDEYFVLDRFKQVPNGCLGPMFDPSILKKIKLLMGPANVMDVGLASIKDLREMGLWKPNEFELLMLSDGTTLSGTLKRAFGTGISAPIALYWSWIEKSSAPDAPLNTKQWIRKELSDSIVPGGIYHVALDKCTLDWLVNAGIAKVAEENSDELFTFPNYDRDRYSQRRAEERTMSLEAWAWSDANAIKLQQSLGVKLVGLEHPKYIPLKDESSMTDAEREAYAVSIPHSGRPESFEDAVAERSAVGYSLTRRASEFLSWARETAADTVDLITFDRSNTTVVTSGTEDTTRVLTTSQSTRTAQSGRVTIMSLGEEDKSDHSKQGAIVKPKGAPTKKGTGSASTTRTVKDKKDDGKVSTMNLF